MKLRNTWDTISTTLEEFDLPPYLEEAVRWATRHPRAVVTGALVLVMAVMLAQTPAEPVEPDPYNGETPLFI